MNRFDIFKLKGTLSKIRDWMQAHHFPPRMLFFLMGIISTVWFLIRVIPKPSRAGYPCMQMAAPFMSSFVVYILSLGSVTLFLRKARKNFVRARYVAAGSFLLVALAGMVISITSGIQDSYAFSQSKFGPDDGPNQPVGRGLGVNPGRVVWVWNPDATNENCKTGFDTQDWYWKPENTNEKVVKTMFRDALNKLTGKSSVAESWDVLFHTQNIRKSNTDKGYTKGEKIFIKTNQGTSRWVLTQEDKDKGYYVPTTLKPEETRRRGSLGTTETGPYIVLELLRELVNELGINQSDIVVGDPMTDTWGHNYDVWVKEFPDVLYTDKFSDMHGRTLISTTEEDLIFYSDKTQQDKLYDVLENADYLINAANLKPHMYAGITLTAKNHFGSQGSPTAGHLHYALMRSRGGGVPNNLGYHKYRVLVDLMGSKYLGQNTVLYIVDGLFGGGASETRGPVKYFMAPFNNDWSSSIFLSQDQVALESVCFDFLRTEWNGINKHDASNNSQESNPNWNGVDDYLHQAADSSNWPEGIKYDPDNSGKPLRSLGTHEHWNDPVRKQYSRNLGKSIGIELVSIPDNLVGNGTYPDATQKDVQGATKNMAILQGGGKTSPESLGINTGKKIEVVKSSFGKRVKANNFRSIVIGDDNTKWFLTENGIVSYDGKKWKMHTISSDLPGDSLKSFIYNSSSNKSELWIASTQGVIGAPLPVGKKTKTSILNTQNTPILSDNVISVVFSKSPLRWFGTNKGVSAISSNKWLTNDYELTYPEMLFELFPITSMAASPDGDSLYVGTKGAGVARIYRNEVDAISGASEYAQWGPIDMPSDVVYSLYIAPDGTQWIGTDMGAARHTGYNTLRGWKVFNKDNGLVDDFVQAIADDKNGKLWFGTKGGVSVYDGTSWTSYTKNDGLNSNNVLCIATDNSGIVWMGTDNGVASFEDGKFTIYK